MLHVIEIEEQTEQTRALDYAMSLNLLGVVYSALGKYNRAEELYQRARALFETHDDLLLLTYPLNGLGALAIKRGEYSQAEELYQQALSLRQQHAEEEIEIAHSMNKLAGVYEKQKNYPQAEELTQQALAIAERELRPEHPDIGLFLNDLAYLYAEQEQYDRAALPAGALPL